MDKKVAMTEREAIDAIRGEVAAFHERCQHHSRDAGFAASWNFQVAAEGRKAIGAIDDILALVGKKAEPRKPMRVTLADVACPTVLWAMASGGVPSLLHCWDVREDGAVEDTSPRAPMPFDMLARARDPHTVTVEAPAGTSFIAALDANGHIGQAWFGVQDGVTCAVDLWSGEEVGALLRTRSERIAAKAKRLESALTSMGFGRADVDRALKAVRDDDGCRELSDLVHEAMFVLGRA